MSSSTPNSGERPKRPQQQRTAPDKHRSMPASDDAEQGVLCSFLIAPREVGNLCVEQGIQEASFHVPAHGTIYSVLVEMWDKAEPIDLVTLTQRLADRKLLQSCGGPAFIAQLFTFLPTASNAAYYVEIVKDKAQAREVIRVGTEFASQAYDNADIASVVDSFEGAVLKIAQARLGKQHITIKAHVMQAITGIEELYERRGAISGLPTGFAFLDAMTDGLHGAEMIVIAARPSMGKTALAMNIAEYLALNLGKAVGVFSLEMSSQQLVQRLLASRARIDLAKVRKGLLSERDFHALTEAGAAIADSKLFLDDTAGLSILELRAKARRWKSKFGLDALFIDYLQLLRSTSRKSADNRQIEISEISSGLKALSKELEIPVVVLAQLNRNPENRAGESKGRPRLSDLRESGSIEQDADLVGLLVREEYYADTEAQREESAGKATLIIAKQRNGPVGDVPLTFLKDFTRFETRAEEAA